MGQLGTWRHRTRCHTSSHYTVYRPVTKGLSVNDRPCVSEFCEQCDIYVTRENENRSCDDMGDSLTDRFISDLVEGCQELIEDIGCLPNIRR